MPVQGEPARDEIAKRDEVVCGTEYEAASKNRCGELSGSRELEIGEGRHRLVDQQPVTMPGTYRRPRTAPATCDQPFTAHSPAADSANIGAASAMNGATSSTTNLSPLITTASVRVARAKNPG